MFKIRNRLLSLITLILVAAIIGGRWEITGAQDSSAPDQPPVISAVGGQTIDLGQSVVVGLTYSDPDGDAVAISAVSDNPSVTVAVTDSQLTLTAAASGSATITVTADDGKGGTSSITFSVTVNTPTQPPAPTNTAPVIGAIGAQTVEAGQSIIVGFSANDAESDPIAINIVSDNPGIAMVVQSAAGQLTVTGIAAGAANITVTADDGKGGTSSTTFAVTVSTPAVPPTAVPPTAAPVNNPPVIAPISAQPVTAGQSVIVPIGYSDPDGDAVAVSLASDNAGVATVVQSSAVELAVSGISAGSATITITLSDGRGGITTAQFAVTVSTPVPTPLPTALATPTIASDLADYNPGQLVTLTGTGWAGDTTVIITVVDAVPTVYHDTDQVQVQADGTIIDSFNLPTTFIDRYFVTAKGVQTGRVATTTFTDANPSADLDQCANDPSPSPNTDGCNGAPSGNDWVNGNLGASKSSYLEGDSIPYRIRFDNLSTSGNHTVIIEWDTTKSSTHAIDYLTSYNRTVGTANPCLGVSGCSTFSTFSIPADPQVTGAGVTPIAGAFTLFGGTISGVSAYSYVDGAGFSGDKSARITITFHANVANPVLAWGGHISTRADWGASNSAVAIPGSPYHSRLISLDGSGGNQDRSLSADAVVFPGSITIIKDATPNGATSFPFTASPSPLSNFSLVDDGTSANTKVFSNITEFKNYTVAESTPVGWSLSSIICSVTTPNGGSQSVTLPSVLIKLNEGENVTCTFNNARTAQNLTVSKTANPAYTTTYTWGIDKKADQNTVNIADGSSATFNYTVTVSHSAADSGWVVNGVITVSNPNSFSVSGVNVTDAINDVKAICSVSGGSSTIAANSSAAFNYTCAYTGAPAASSQTNTATATWTNFGSPNTSASGTAAVNWSSATQTLTDETVTVTDPNAPSSVLPATVTYTDPSPKDFTYAKSFSGVAGTCTNYNNTATYITNDSGNTFSASKSVQVCVGKDLAVSKTVDASKIRTYKWTIDKSVDQTQIKIADGGTATFNYSVLVSPDGFIDGGYTLGGSITVSNPNDWEAITLSSLTDTLDAGGTCTITEASPYVVPKSGSLTVHYTCTTDGSSSKNTATATWDKTTAFTPTNTATGNATVSSAIGSEVNKTVIVVDDKTNPASPVTLGTVNWSDGARTFTYSLNQQGVGGKCTDYTNTAKLSETGQSDSQKVTLCVGKDLTVSKTAAGTFNRAYLWDISKSVDQASANIADGASYTFSYSVVVNQTGISDSGWTLSGKITVANPNDWEAITTDVTDVVDNGGICTVVGGTGVSIPASGSKTFDYTCSYASAPSSYSGTNTATATWDKTSAFTPSGSASGDATFTLSQSGSTNKTIHVTDNFGGALGTVTANDSTPYASETFNYRKTFSGFAGTCTTYKNTATITETNQSASKSVTLCVGKNLTVSKTAAGTFDRTYLWKIAKSVDKASVNIADGSSYTFHYTVDVEQTGISDSGWTLSGVITVSNPNDWEAITTDVTDVVDNGGVCTVVGGTGVIIPASGSKTFDYTCSYASAPSSYSGTNTATATWDKTSAFTPSGSASGDATFTLSQKGSTNKTVHVTDSYKGALGTVSATDSAPFASDSFTYDRTETGVAGTCTTYDNTATITETNQSASKSVTLCVGKDLTVSKTAAGTFNRAYLWSIGKNVDQASANIPDGASYTFSYSVAVKQTGISDSGWTLSGVITVSNPNDWEAITTDVTDVVDNGGVCTVVGGTGVSIPASGSKIFDYTCSYVSAPSSYSGTNTATATWDKTANFTPSGSASGTATFMLSQLGSTNKTIHVTDSSAGDLGTVTATDSAPFTSKTFAYPRTENGVAGTCKTYDNTATITETNQPASKSVTLCVGKDLTVSKTAAGTFDRTYLWKIAKSVDQTKVSIADGSSYTFHYTVDVEQTGISDSGWTLSGVITVSNPNDWEDVTLTSLSDALNVGGTCTVANGPYVVPKNGSIDVAYSCTFGSAPSSYSGTNTATATWDKTAAFTPSASASGNAAFTLSQKGSTNKTVHITDSYKGALGTVSATDSAPFASGSFTYDRTENGVAGTCTTYDNSATITETQQSASKSVTLCVGKDLTVSKTAAGTFDRTYLWKIAKSVDQTKVSIADGSSYTFHYTVDVEQTGISDSGWTLSGKITVANPNDWEAITANITDVVDNGGVCTVVGGTGVIIPASGSKTFDYTCSYASAPSSYSGTNTATATWNASASFTPSGSASGNAAFTLSQKGSTNNTVHVTDSFAGALGTVSATDSAPFTKQSFTYDRTENGVAGTCKTYDNTATITETNQSASKSVTLCVGKDLTVSKTATPTFTRTFKWDITKDVDKSFAQQNSSSVGFNYTVTASQTGVVDSAWKVVGTIKVANPNDWEAITANITDVVDNGGVCTVVGGTAVSIPASGSKTFDYTCSYASAPSSNNGINTATATWDKAGSFTPSGSASGTATFVFDTGASSNPTNVDMTVKVTDTFNGSTVTLGTLTGTTSSPYTSATYTYNQNIDVPAAACKSYTNTAEILGDNNGLLDSDSETVKVCKPSLFTDSLLCSLTNNQFRLIYTPDQLPSNGWKLNASAPGQFYYNSFYTGPGNVDITVNLPYPWVTQGAVPIHVYNDVGVTTNSSGQTCLTPISELSNETDQVTLATYDGTGNPPSYNFTKTTQVTIHVPSTGTKGFAYINIHLDYGLKGTTGYAKDTNNNAVRNGTSTILISDLKNYAFTDTNLGSITTQSTNVFKKNPGIGGLVLDSYGNPIKGATVKIYQSASPTGTPVATMITDEDGWYMWSYKWTGKAATFTVTMKPPTPYIQTTQQQTVTLKANGYLVVGFTVQ